LEEKDCWKFFDCLRDFNNKTAYEERLAAIGLSVRSRDGKEPGYFPFRELGSFLAQQERVVDTVSYSLNPNHFHLILRQLQDKGISNFMHKVGLGFTNYFNKKYEHSGHVLQGPFKAIEIDSEEYLMWLLGYVNGNIEIHGLGRASGYPWSSYQAICKSIIGKKLSRLSALTGLEFISERFKNLNEFEKHIGNVIEESKEIKASKEKEKRKMRKYLLESL